MNIYLKNLFKKEACMFSTVCTRYIHVALAAYVPMLWERCLATHATILWCCPRMYQHEIKKNIWLFFYIYLP